MSESSADKLTGRIFEIQRFSIHDGPGIRTTVFMKGCSLRCRWCHNPEGQSPEPQISFLPDKCIGCGYCLKVCPHEAHRLENERHVLDRERCEVCGLCTKECYAGALEFVGREITVAETLEEVLRDLPFYENSGGGMTLSGGEPLFQFEFTKALLRAAKDAGLHCCLETSGQTEHERLEQIRPHVDLFLYDYKETDPQRHQEYTGVSNDKIRDNLSRLHAAGARIRLRCPIVPGYNDREDHFAGIAALAQELPDLEGVELMPYHRLGESKLERFGMANGKRIVAQTPDQAAIAHWTAALASLGLTVLNPD